MEFWADGELMTEWHPDTCTSHAYAEGIVKCVRDRVAPQSTILMLGLGGGAIGAQLCDEYDVTVLEISQEVIQRAHSFFQYFRACGLHPEKMRIHCADAFHPPKLGEFDVLIQDIPPCYLGKSAQPIRACSHNVKSLLISNFHSRSYVDKLMRNLKDIWTVDAVEQHEYN